MSQLKSDPMAAWRRTLTLAVLLFGAVLLTTAASDGASEGDEVARVSKEWMDFEGRLKKTFNKAMSKAVPTVMKMMSSANMSSDCTSALLHLVLGVKNTRGWAMKMMDASSKPPSGLLYGTLSSFGTYDQCLEISAPDSYNKSIIKFTGQFCLLELQFELPPKPYHLTLQSKVFEFDKSLHNESILWDLAKGSPLFYLTWTKLGMCLPSACSTTDLQNVFDIALKDVPMIPTVQYCKKDDTRKLEKIHLVIFGIAGGLLLMSVLGTLVHLCGNSDEKEIGRVRKFFLCFSLRLNLRKLLSTSASSDNLAVLNGLRTLCMFWILLTHVYGFTDRFGYGNLENARKVLKDPFFQIIINSWTSVDTFFLIGALLAANAILKDMDKTGGKVNVIKLYFRRIWRLMPPMLLCTGAVFVLPFFGHGPIWDHVLDVEVDRCTKRWWGVAFFLNPYVNMDDMCMFHTWYVGADFHYYVAAPLLVYLLWRNVRWGVVVLALLSVASSAAIAVVTYLNDLYPTVLVLAPDLEYTYKIIDLIYFKVFSHIGPYCLGLFMGYLVLRHRKASMPKFLQVLAWAASWATGLGIVFVAYQWNNGYLPPLSVSVVYAGLHRFGWTLSVAWVIWACISGCGGPINTLLSWKVFLPLNRLTYLAYLVQFPILWTRSAWRQRTIPFNNFEFVMEFFGMLVLTLLISSILYLVLEGPLVNLDALMFPKKKTVKRPIEEEEKKVPLPCSNVVPHPGVIPKEKATKL